MSNNRHGFAPNNTTTIYNLSINGISRLLSMRTFTGDIDIFYEVLWKKIYDQTYEEIGKIQTIIDLGANIGIASLYFSVKYHNAKIYGIEPDPDNFELLLGNMKTEIEEKRFFPVHAAISNYTGIAYIDKSEKAYNTKISMSPVSTLTVKTIDLNTFFAESGIKNVDLLKIDIEGAEMEVFSGDVSFLQFVNNIVMECHSPLVADCCKPLLLQHGFHLTHNSNSMNLLWAKKVRS